MPPSGTSSPPTPSPQPTIPQSCLAAILTKDESPLYVDPLSASPQLPAVRLTNRPRYPGIRLISCPLPSLWLDLSGKTHSRQLRGLNQRQTTVESGSRPTSRVPARGPGISRHRGELGEIDSELANRRGNIAVGTGKLPSADTTDDRGNLVTVA